jgi:hypothetical protein
MPVHPTLLPGCFLEDSVVLGLWTVGFGMKLVTLFSYGAIIASNAIRGEELTSP